MEWVLRMPTSNVKVLCYVRYCKCMVEHRDALSLLGRIQMMLVGNMPHHLVSSVTVPAPSTSSLS